MNSLMQTGCMPLQSNETSANIKEANLCFQHICSLGEEKLSGEVMLQEETSWVAIKLFLQYWQRMKLASLLYALARTNITSVLLRVLFTL